VISDIVFERLRKVIIPLAVNAFLKLHYVSVREDNANIIFLPNGIVLIQ